MRFYLVEVSLLAGGVEMLRAIDGMDPSSALLWMARQLLRRHRDQVLRARRGPRSEVSRLLWKASRLLSLAGRLARDAGRASQYTVDAPAEVRVSFADGINATRIPQAPTTLTIAKSPNPASPASSSSRN